MPSDAPAIKRERVAADGAQSWSVGPASDERQQVAEAIAAERGLTIIPPFDDDRIIAGQGTVGLEIVEELPDLAACSSRSVAAGWRAGSRRRSGRSARRPASSASNPSSRPTPANRSQRGEIVPWPAELVSRTIADGTRTQALGARTFAHLRPSSTAIVTVSEAEIAAAVRLARRAQPARGRAVRRARRSPRWRSTRGSSGSTAVAGPIVAVVSGGNVDPGGYRALPRRPRSRRRVDGGRPRDAPPTSRAALPPLAALVGQALGQASLADPDLGQLGVGARSARASSRASARIQPTTTSMIAVRKMTSPAIHMIPAASCWSSSTAIPHGRTSVA